MMSVYIKALSYYLPEKVLTNDELVKEFPKWSVEKIASKVGISSRHIANPDETAGDMAFMAAEQLFHEYQIDRSTIDFIILCSQSPDYFLPSTSCILQDRLKLSTQCGAFDFNLGCSGYEYGLAVAKGLIFSKIASNVLLLTAETYTKYLNQRDKGNRTIFADGASASIISTNGFAEIGDFDLGTDGSGYANLIVKSGAARHKNMLNDTIIDDNGNIISSDFLFMDGKAIFDYTTNVVPMMVERTLAKNNLSMQEIDLFVFHQANKYMINYIRKILAIDKERFFVYLDSVGNTVSSTIPIALKEVIKEGKLHGKILIAGFGVGLSYGATILSC